MKTMHSKNRSSQRGVALLIAIFALLLISGVAMSLVMMSGTETSMAANYRSTSQSFYASYSGLEEGRTRLWQNFPITAGGSIAAAWYAPGVIGDPVPVNSVMYILNNALEVVNPLNLIPSNPYADNQYQTEFGIPPTAAVLKGAIASNAFVAGMPGPAFKWVRITPKTERSSQIDVNGDGIFDPLTPLYSDGKNQYVGNLTGDYQQVFRITALSVASGSRRILQYDTMRVVFNLTVPSALTFDGSGSALFPANSAVYEVEGFDALPTPANTPPGGCPPPGPAKPAVGVVSPGDDTAITQAIEDTKREKNYTGSGGTLPDVQDISALLKSDLTTVGGIQDMITNLNNNATSSLTAPPSGPITNSSFTDASGASGLQIGSPATPEVVVANGALELSGNVTGYGILVVTGDFVVKGNFTWQGIVLVMGTGTMTVGGGGGGTIDGALLLARTVDAAGNPLPPGDKPGGSTLDWAGGGGNGIHYNSCNITNSNNANAIYRVLSFREVQ